MIEKTIIMIGPKMGASPMAGSLSIIDGTNIGGTSERLLLTHWMIFLNGLTLRI